MPNHIRNVITADPQILANIAELFKGTDSLVDFNKLIQMPSDIPLGDLSIRDRDASNGHNWLDWSRKHWGTKWNAYSCDVDSESIVFDTAWDAPRPIIKALAKRILGPWSWAYADEDIGQNCGTFTCNNGVLDHIDPASVFAIALRGWDVADYLRDRREDADCEQEATDA